ncbi:MAG: DUF4032 domain-containing protein [Anaerolineae bacterium]|nr:DUF4032 domain-containing protein [Anaerolineae bacterium]
MVDTGSRNRAQADYGRATRQAQIRNLWANLSGKNNSLLRYEDVKGAAGLYEQHYRGVQPIRVDRIIGSFGRSDEFDRAFLPKRRHTSGKWVSVDAAVHEGIELPPISVYKVGDPYFVVDGHHRVSVARRNGQVYIDAEVIEVESKVPVTADLTPDDLDAVSAYREFLEQTHLDVLRPRQHVELTMPGDYGKLLDHIRVHKYFVERERKESLDWSEAVEHWYDQVYTPLVEAIRHSQILDEFPGHTETDLYLWIIEHAYYLSEKLGRSLDPWKAVGDYVERFGQRPRRSLQRIVRRIRDAIMPESLEPGPSASTWRQERLEPYTQPHIFPDILVTITGAESGWLALSQAAEIARRESGTLHGFHVAKSDSDEDHRHTMALLEEFAFRCESLGAEYTTSWSIGDPAREIIERARWNDLVVINQRRMHGRLAESPLGTIFQMVAEQSARPILAVPGTAVRVPERAILAFDGSPKAREALFVFRHILTCWNIRGLVITVDTGRNSRATLESALEYLAEAGHSQMDGRFLKGEPHEVLLKVMQQEQSDLLLMGGYGHQPLLKAFLGSAVDRVLREAWFPVLICR